MAHDPPALSLSDIIHTTSPSPQYHDDDLDASASPSTTTPEPLDPSQIEAMRKRVMEMMLPSVAKLNPTPRERELLTMVLRLTSYTVSEPAQLQQLHAQAATILDLSKQREALLHESEEAQARWKVEREGFERMAEALIVRKSRGVEASYREEELERQVATLDADNRVLRHKVILVHRAPRLSHLNFPFHRRYPSLRLACNVSSLNSHNCVLFCSCSPLLLPIPSNTLMGTGQIRQHSRPKRKCRQGPQSEETMALVMAMDIPVMTS
ncbi:hypothetical protein OF83DRAFT_1187291 [Amylostereum chailletii]|nr:hypothetical protein OF83DRAFT_1187291 [Amylostereum chailletii]